MKFGLRKVLAAVCAAGLTASFAFPVLTNAADKSGGSMINLSEGTDYSFSYRGTLRLSNDDVYQALTEKVSTKYNLNYVYATITNQTGSLTNGWGNTPPTIDFDTFGDSEPYFYLKNDFGFVSELSKSSIVFKQQQGTVLPKKVELYYSNDGYNFNFFGGELEKTTNEDGFITYSKTFSTALKAKAVKYVVYAQEEQTVALVEIKNMGKQTNKQVLVSQGAKYDLTIGTALSSDDVATTALTDGKTGRLTIDDHYMLMADAQKDPKRPSSRYEVVIDLGSRKNVSEVAVSNFVDTFMGIGSLQYIRAYSSTDGNNYKDFSMSYLYSTVGGSAYKDTFKAMRNHTVEARYIKVALYVSNTTSADAMLAVDEIKVMGSDTAVAEPDYGFTENDITGNTNVAKNKPVTVNGTAQPKLSDMIFRSISTGAYVETVKAAPVSNKIEIVADLGKVFDKITGFEINLAQEDTANVKNIELYLSENGTSYTSAGQVKDGNSLTDMTTYRLYLKTLKARYVKAVITTEANKTVGISEIQVFNGTSQLPKISGGWYSAFLNVENDRYTAFHFFDEYLVYMFLKGYKELGMEVVVAPQAVEYETKLTMGPVPESLKAKGYKQASGHGVDDVYEAIFSAADKLKMKVFIGSILADKIYPDIVSKFATPAQKIAAYKKITDEVNVVIEENYHRYKHHKSFYGLYMTDETCDYWMADKNGVGAQIYRTFYKSQIDLMRSLDPSKVTMASPAIWRAGGQEELRKNIATLIKADEEGGRPLVDIIAAQDCLGREQTVTITDSVYRVYDSYLQNMALGVQDAGGVYWADMEQFNVAFRAKEYDELVNSTNLHSRYSGGLLIFDFSTYFSVIGQGSFNTQFTFKNDHIVMEYIKYLANDMQESNNFVMNKNAFIELEIDVTDSENADKALAGAIFELRDAKDVTVATLTTDDQGKASVTLDGVTLGRYSLVQKNAVDGYLKPQSALKFALGNESAYKIDGDKYTYTINLTNSKIGSVLKLYNVDADDDSIYVVGGVYDVFSGGKAVERLTINRFGEGITKILPYGDYTVKQVSAAEGYFDDDKTYTISLTEEKEEWELKILSKSKTAPVDPEDPGDNGSDGEDGDDENPATGEKSAAAAAAVAAVSLTACAALVKKKKPELN